MWQYDWMKAESTLSMNININVASLCLELRVSIFFRAALNAPNTNRLFQWRQDVKELPSQDGWQHPAKSGAEQLEENPVLQLVQTLKVRSRPADRQGRFFGHLPKKAAVCLTCSPPPPLLLPVPPSRPDCLRSFRSVLLLVSLCCSLLSSAHRPPRWSNPVKCSLYSD